MSMDPHVVLLLTLILLLGTGDGSLAVGTPSAIIRTTCAAVGQPGRGVDYDSCVGALSADPAAAAAKDARELAVVATNLTVANVTSTVLVLDDLVKNLGDCLRSYRDMNKNLEGALGDLAAGRLKAASDKLLHASFAPSDCDILLLEGSAEKNPVSEENNDAGWLSRLAYVIATF
ncbi:putative invertase inhibitor [Triticum dicoccoides]|uniref:putative invertase inhibitor n=1 Tax=Triticum dicoccoides TaxID=85692 RepID=UPI000E7C52B7|nr:putative invertase inhibitor [Triticum dicoccoides]